MSFGWNLEKRSMILTDLLEESKNLSSDSKVFIQQGDKSYPATMRIFQRGHGRKNREMHICIEENSEPIDFPDGFAGVRELKKFK